MVQRGRNTGVRMKIVVVGSGAMGGLFGGLLAEAGHDVVLLDIAGSHLDALRRDGLWLSTDEGERLIPIKAGIAAEFSEVCDLALVFTKGPHTEAAMRASAHLIGPESWVLTVQNGLGNAASIRRAVPHAKVAVGMTGLPADLTSPGHVASHGHGGVRFWSEDGAPDPALSRIEAVLREAGLGAVADPAVEVAIWEKVAFNAALNSACAVTQLPVGVVGDHEAGHALAAAVVAETMDVACARGLAVDAARVAGMVATAFAEHRGHKPSMLQDVLAGRPTEIETINGAIVAAGEELGIATPVTRTLRDLVRLIDHRNRLG
jgi:2-dehydropantoate 2-reductase